MTLLEQVTGFLKSQSLQVRVARRYFADTIDEGVETALEAIISYANHNKRLPTNVVQDLKKYLASDAYPHLFVPPTHAVCLRGDHTTVKLFYKDSQIDASETTEGERGVTLNLFPGSSWTTDPEQAQYHAYGDARFPVEVIYEAQPKGAWLDMRLLYKLPRLRGLRLEYEVICLEEHVQCKASWINTAID